MDRRRFMGTTMGLGATATASRLFASSDPCKGGSASSMDLVQRVGENGPRYAGTAAVWFSSHYQVDSRDWDNIKEFGNDYHPLAGYYKSDDPAILKKQLHWMRRAGIDAIVYDVFSTGVWHLTDLPKDKTLKLLLEELANQENEPRKLKLIIWFETYWRICQTASG
jgi:hypothetical protein